jgi:hypothetical protein
VLTGRLPSTRLFGETAGLAEAHGFRPAADPFGWCGRVS